MSQCSPRKDATAAESVLRHSVSSESADVADWCKVPSCVRCPVCTCSESDSESNDSVSCVGGNGYGACASVSYVCISTYVCMSYRGVTLYLFGRARAPQCLGGSRGAQPIIGGSTPPMMG